MAIDPFQDELIEMTAVSSHLPRSVSASTLRKWWKYGIRGVRLETTKIGPTRYTTKAALSEFFAARAKQDEHQTFKEERDDKRRSQLVQAGLL